LSTIEGGSSDAVIVDMGTCDGYAAPVCDARRRDARGVERTWRSREQVERTVNKLKEFENKPPSKNPRLCVNLNLSQVPTTTLLKFF
jgi:hypothetical protein